MDPYRRGMTRQRIALITGANQGIGYSLVEGLAARWSPHDVVLLTGRNPASVAEAAIRAPRASTTVARVEGKHLDVTDVGAIARTAAEIGEQFGGIDIVISNATARSPRSGPRRSRPKSIAVANGGTDAMLRSFGSVVRPGGRLIVVASALGTIGHLDKGLHSLLDDVSLDEVATVVESWRSHPRWHRPGSRLAGVDKRAVEGRPGRRRCGRSHVSGGPPIRLTAPWSPRCARDWSTPQRHGPGSTTSARPEPPPRRPTTCSTSY